MKITLTRMSSNLPFSRTRIYHRQSDEVEGQLFKYLHQAAYGEPAIATWTKLSQTLQRLDHIIVDLSEMAAILRAQDWCVYYWRDRNGTQEGLIFGQYCPNLTAWLLANT